MGGSSVAAEWLPVCVAATAACAVAFVAYQQAASAAQAEDEQETAAARQAARQQLSSTRHTQQHRGAPAQRQQQQQIGSSSRCTTASGSSGGEAAAPEPPAAAAPGRPPATCDFCHKPARQEALLRCSRCRHALYCGPVCQRSAWPAHKRSCGKHGSAASSAASSASSSAATSPTAAQGASRGSGSVGADLPPPARPKQPGGSADGQQQQQHAGDTASMLDVLKHYLQQHSDAQADPLQQQFEQAVLLYVRQEHRTALAQLQAVQRAAEQQGQLALAGDASKWSGHAYAKLGEPAKAAAAFASGCELAERSGNKKLQVDCLSGMGAMYRDHGQLAAAEGFLRQALRCADALGDGVVRASCLTHLGGVLVASDAGAAIGHLEEAVALREDQVVQLHEEGKRGSALATAIMEHAGSLVSLAGAYYARRRYADAADAYSKSLQVFTMVEDTDKACKCRVNLANLYELQIQHPDTRAHAAEQRRALYELSRSALGRGAPETCAICCEAIDLLEPTAGDDARLLLLGCLHGFHLRCWEGWSEHQSTCPSCKQPNGPLAPAPR